jgi:hypothetical protein
MNTGCPTCANKAVLTGYNDLATTHPQLILEALFDPTKVIAGSNRKLPWKCAIGHEWTATGATRIKGSGCPFCTNYFVFTGFNDLATTHPHLATEALFDATKIMAGTGKKLLWKCPKGHEWKATPNSRTSKGSGCPSCAVTGYDPNEQGWVYLMAHPDWEMTQIGITNVPKDRVGLHASRGWELYDLRGPMDGNLARQWETDILRYVKKQGVKLSPMGEGGNFSGYTEAWWTKDLRVEKLKVLMDEIDAIETGA